VSSGQCQWSDQSSVFLLDTDTGHGYWLARPMKRLATIFILTYVFFLVEFLLFDVFGRWGKPDLLLILIVFFNLYLGIRYGLLTACLAGIFKDAFSSEVFGTYIFLFMCCAFFSTVMRRNFYRPGSRLSRLMVIGGVVTVFVFAQGLLYAMNHDLDWKGVIQYVFIPEILITMLSATFIFSKLKYLADKIHL
jgi:rod shape-determining protein MreD